MLNLLFVYVCHVTVYNEIRTCLGCGDARIHQLGEEEETRKVETIVFN